MTVTFSPGDVNSPACVDQIQWKNHRLVVYGSGNNVIIHSMTYATSTCNSSVFPSLQTLYADRDVTAVAINGETGLICAAYGPEIVLLRPLNEYMSIPKWQEAARVLPSNLKEREGEISGNVQNHVQNHVLTYSQVNHILCARWAPSESELVVGTGDAIYLLHVDSDYAQVTVSCRWHKSAASAVGMVDISPDASKIIAYNTQSLDHFAKVWMRITYGENTLFELAYADHGPELWLVDFKWRRRAVDKTAGMNLQVMANIRDLRTFMPNFSASEENCILYTVTSDHVLHVWATCDFNGHNYLKLWARLELPEKVADYRACIVLETGDAGSDLLLVEGQAESCLVQIHNLNHNPPNAVTFEEIARFKTEDTCLPSRGNLDTRTSSSPVERIRMDNCFIRCSDAVSQNGNVFFICSDAIKKTLRSVQLELSDPKCPLIALEEKFSGHSKSVTKLFTSSTSYSGNIMLSVSRFGNENYIWEPVPVQKRNHGKDDSSSEKTIAISKRFRLNIENSGDFGEKECVSCIQSAVLINDIFPPKTSRRHLAVTIESGGYISFWDCDGASQDESDAWLISRLSVEHEQGRLEATPQAFFSEKISPSLFIIIAVYSPVITKAWRVECTQEKGDKNGSEQNGSGKTRMPLLFSAKPVEEFQIEPILCTPFPGEYGPSPKVSNISTFLEKDLSVIDKNGVLRLLAVEHSENTVKWRQTCEIHTNLQNPTFIHGASVIGKLAIIDGMQLTIWDCTSGVLEYSETFPAELGPPRDLDWTFMGDTRSTTYAILSVGFARVVLLYTQLRYDYTNRIPTFAVVKRIDISNYTEHEIGDSVWLDDHYLVISSGNQFFVEDGRVSIGNGTSPIEATVQELLGFKRDQEKSDEKESDQREGGGDLALSEVVRILNGPLAVYHPQFLIQALLMDEDVLVKNILVRLLRFLRQNRPISWNLDLEAGDILCMQESVSSASSSPTLSGNSDDDVFSSFGEAVVRLLLTKLASVSLPLITRHQQITLSNVIKVVSHSEQYRTSLDANGLKFVYSFGLFQSSPKKKTLNMRDVSWALHSDQKEMLFGLLQNVYHRMTWSTICTTGIVYWVDRIRLEKTLESVAQNEFADSRDPSGRVSVLYLALRKKKVLVGLWNTVTHGERAKMLKFLGNDFSEPRWKSAAAKNAFVLLGKHRYLDSAAFFLLADQIYDCCMVLCNKMQDIELALAVARVNDESACVQAIIEQYVLPRAVEHGDRWMTSWAFWQMKKKAWSIQALLHTPHACVQDHLSEFSDRFQTEFQALHFVPESASFLRDDPVLGVLYSNLRSAKQTYLEGAMEVSAQTEFDFVIKLANIYSRMGCDYLSVMLLTRWQFLAEKTEKTEAHEAFSEFSARKNLAPVSHDAGFAEPDMSAFEFGF